MSRITSRIAVKGTIAMTSFVSADLHFCGEIKATVHWATTEIPGVNIPQTHSWLWFHDKAAAYALRDALNEILEGVPVPPEDEVIGLTTEFGADDQEGVG